MNLYEIGKKLRIDWDKTDVWGESLADIYNREEQERNKQLNDLVNWEFERNKPKGASIALNKWVKKIYEES